MDKQAVYDFLRTKGIPFEKMEHGAVYTMEEIRRVALPHPEAEAKNLFVRDDRHGAYYLICVRGDRRVDLKAFRREYGTRPLSFASAEELGEVLGLAPGSVTPLGLLNDEMRRTVLCMDESFLEDGMLIGCHPNDNTASVWLEGKTLVRLIEEHGNRVIRCRL